MMNNADVRQTPVKPPIRLKTYLTWLLIAALAWVSAHETDVSPGELASGLPEMGKFIVKMFPPDWSYLTIIIDPMLETIRMAILGTTFGAILALPVSLFAAGNVTKLAWLRIPARLVLNLVRTVPDLLFAAFFAAIFGYGPVAGILALTFFSFGVLAKWAYEAMETIDGGPLEAMTAAGANKVQWIQYGVLPQVTAQFAGFILYMFEINVRAAAVLGIVGAGGIGVYLNRTLGLFRYNQTSTIIISTLLIVLIIDGVSSWIRGRLL